MRCANPACACESLYLRDGGLYWINPDSDEYWCGLDERTRKIIWLCPDCSKHFVVETWRPPGEQIRPRNSDNDASTELECAMAA